MTDQQRRHHDADHDLLVRIDERLNSMQTLFAGVLTRVGALETWQRGVDQWRAEQDGERRANARTIAAIVACSSGLTAVAVKSVEKLLG